MPAEFTRRLEVEDEDAIWCMTASHSHSFATSSLSANAEPASRAIWSAIVRQPASSRSAQ
jgi:hypothetical protein